VGFRIAEGHDPGTPAGMRREDAVVQDEVYASARDQDGELFEELQGLEEQVAGAVGRR
jgi:BMFP domain-containing protein YqiC